MSGSVRPAPPVPVCCHHCWNHSAQTRTVIQDLIGPGMIVCPDCGNKRCPHANDHRLACTQSNEPGQPGSAYP